MVHYDRDDVCRTPDLEIAAIVERAVLQLRFDNRASAKIGNRQSSIDLSAVPAQAGNAAERRDGG